VSACAVHAVLHITEGIAMKARTGILLALPVLATAGCNIVEGVGNDMKSGGPVLERAADQAKPN
jgi:predicted small secreted protein